MHRYLQMFAAYNRWANTVVYDACEALTEAEYRTDKGAFFGSAHRTLNHLLVADRIWMKRMSGSGDAPDALDTILFDDRVALRQARATEDQRIIEWVDTLTDERLSAPFSYTPISNPTVITHSMGPALLHMFNHQTHHRGQLHTILTSLGKPSVTLDMISFLRGKGSQWM